MKKQILSIIALLGLGCSTTPTQAYTTSNIVGGAIAAGVVITPIVFISHLIQSGNKLNRLYYVNEELKKPLWDHLFIKIEDYISNKDLLKELRKDADEYYALRNKSYWGNEKLVKYAVKNPKYTEILNILMTPMSELGLPIDVFGGRTYQELKLEAEAYYSQQNIEATPALIYDYIKKELQLARTKMDNLGPYAEILIAGCFILGFGALAL